MFKKIVTWTLALALVLSSAGAFAGTANQNRYSNLEPNGETKVSIALGVQEYFQWYVPAEVTLKHTKKQESKEFFADPDNDTYTVGVSHVLLKNDGRNDRAITISCIGYSTLKSENDEISDWELRSLAYPIKVVDQVYQLDAFGFSKKDDANTYPKQLVTIPKTGKTPILTVRTDYSSGSECYQKLLRVDELVAPMGETEAKEAAELYTTENKYLPVRASVLQPSNNFSEKNVYFETKTNPNANLAADSNFRVDTVLYYSVYGKGKKGENYEGSVTYSAEIKNASYIGEVK